MTFSKVVDEALEIFVADYSILIYEPRTEADIQGYLFHLCMLGCSKYGLALDVHLNHKHKLLGTRRKIDMIVGGCIAVEVKYEANYPGVSKPVVLKEEVLKDLERIKYLKDNGFTSVYFLFVDEDGEHFRNSMFRYNIPQTDWITINDSMKNRYILKICK